MKKKIFVCLIAASLLCGSISMPINNIHQETTTASAAVYDTVPEGYTGIYTIDDLYAIRNNPSENYILMNDIDMSETAPGGDWDNGNGWKPICSGNDDATFTGTFDGNGYAIKNMHIFGTLDDDVVGLFGACEGNIIRTAIIDCNIDVTVPFGTGVLIGAVCADNTRYVKECYTTGKINVNINSKATDSYYYRYFIGGIVGYGGVENSFNTCNISVTIDEKTDSSVRDKNMFYIAGISGFKDGIYSSDRRYIRYLYNTGTVKVFKDENAYGDYYIGNIAASPVVTGDDYTISCYYPKTLSDYTAFGDYPDSSSGYKNVSSLTIGQMKSSAAFTGFDFDKVWEIDPNAEYPYPTLINVPYVSTQSSIVEPTQPTTNPSISTGTKKGDMNGDGLVDAVDASLILAYYAYLSTGGTIDDIDEWMQNG